MPRQTTSPAEPGSFPLLAQETLYVGVDIGKRAHVAGFLSVTLLTRHQRFEHCPALSFDNSREGFRSLLDRIQTFVPLTQVQVLLEVTGHYHRALMQYLQNLDIPVYIIHVQKRREGLLKSDKRDALGLANQLYNQLESATRSPQTEQSGERRQRNSLIATFLTLDEMSNHSDGRVIAIPPSRRLVLKTMKRGTEWQNGKPDAYYAIG